MQLNPRSLIRRMPSGVRKVAAISVASLLGVQRRNYVLPSSTEFLNDQYACGSWTYLGSVDEMPRYAVIAGYCSSYAAARSVLDLGCGEGTLARWLLRNDLDRYVGVDKSEVAIDNARSEFGNTGEFIASDIAEYVPSEKFDTIIFNEVLYYFEKPSEILRYYSQFLARDGYFIISLWDSSESELAWRRRSEIRRSVP